MLDSRKLFNAGIIDRLYLLILLISHPACSKQHPSHTPLATTAKRKS